MNPILTIIDKEWAEVFKNKMVLFTIIFMPLFFTLLPLVMVYFTRSTTGAASEMTDMPATFARACGLISGAECLQIYLINQFMIMYMIMPLMIPIAIAAYSIVGEKTTRSLEPLLATPVSTIELLAGKALAAVLPAVGATWACFGIFIVGLIALGAGQAVIRYVTGPIWVIAIFLVGPLIAVAATNLALIVSSRVNDPRAAEQISAVLIVPLLGLLFGQILGFLVINTGLMLLAALVMFLIAAGLLYLAARLFQRETILTRWR